MRVLKNKLSSCRTYSCIHTFIYRECALNENNKNIIKRTMKKRHKEYNCSLIFSQRFSWFFFYQIALKRRGEKLCVWHNFFFSKKKIPLLSNLARRQKPSKYTCIQTKAAMNENACIARIIIGNFKNALSNFHFFIEMHLKSKKGKLNGERGHLRIERKIGSHVFNAPNIYEWTKEKRYQ